MPTFHFDQSLEETLINPECAECGGLPVSDRQAACQACCLHNASPKEVAIVAKKHNPFNCNCTSDRIVCSGSLAKEEDYL